MHVNVSRYPIVGFVIVDFPTVIRNVLYKWKFPLHTKSDGCSAMLKKLKIPRYDSL